MIFFDFAALEKVLMTSYIDYIVKRLGMIFVGAFESIREEKTQPANKMIGFTSPQSEEKEYTIREKVAQILFLTNNVEFEQLKKTLQADENYYVREVFKQN